MSQPTQPFRVPHWMLPPPHLCSQEVDEFCDCGHSVHDHEDVGPAYGHGECGWVHGALGRPPSTPDCPCKKFLWARLDEGAQ